MLDGVVHMNTCCVYTSVVSMNAQIHTIRHVPPTQQSTVEPLYSGHHGTRRDCTDYEVVLISGGEDALRQSIMYHLAPVSIIGRCPQLRGRGVTVLVNPQQFDLKILCG